MVTMNPVDELTEKRKWMLTAYKVKYWAYEILSTQSKSELSKVSGAISSSNIDLNPHQIQASMFALQSPISQGVILADEVGLGKTIEAGLVLSEYFLRGKSQLIIVCPASLRKQWERELEDKFDIPTRIMDRKIYDYFRGEHKDPFNFNGAIICSYNFASSFKTEIHGHNFDLAVIDEAHKLRNLYKGKTKIADNLRDAFYDTKKLLLTATPIQNSLMDIYSLVSFIDENIFGNEYSFMENYLYSEKRHQELKKRLKSVMHRTLRRDVLEYIKYTKREAITVAFDPSSEEIQLYNMISDYIGKKSSYGIQTRFRTLIVLMIRKLMSSSTTAVEGTLEGIKARLQALKGDIHKAYNIEEVIKDNDLLEDYEDEIENTSVKEIAFRTEDIPHIDNEIAYLDMLLDLAKKIKIDGKTKRLLSSLEMGFKKITSNGGLKKVIIFTESQRTMKYLFNYLSKNGYRNKIITFSGTNNSELCNKVYNEYKMKNPLDLSGSKSADMRQALIDKFKNDSEIMIATEAGAEGLNLQFCSMLVNYDLPWNPQRVEQRIGRIHRYGQKHDVVIINFINKSNVADVRLYDILQRKFKLFDGVFGASDEILGTLSDGVDFEKAISEIFDHCRTPAEIEKAFDALQEQLGERKEETIEETKQLVLENFNPTIAEKLHVLKDAVDEYIERAKHIFWELTKEVLKQSEKEIYFNEEKKIFGSHKEQVLDGLYQTTNFAYNFAFELDFSRKDREIQTWDGKRERRSKNLKPMPYNPSTDRGKNVLERALELPTEQCHLVSTGGERKARGRVKMTLYKRLTPEVESHLITTFITDTGEELNINPAEFFDNLQNTGEFKETGFDKIMEHLHEKKIKSVGKKDKRGIESILKDEVEKLNRWAHEEKSSMKYQLKSLENKLVSIKGKYRKEKNFEEKLNIGKDIEKIQKKIKDMQVNVFDKQSSITQKAKQLIGGRKRALKYTYEISDIMDCSFEVVLLK